MFGQKPECTCITCWACFTWQSSYRSRTWCNWSPCLANIVPCVQFITDYWLLFVAWYITSSFIKHMRSAVCHSITSCNLRSDQVALQRPLVKWFQPCGQHSTITESSAVLFYHHYFSSSWLITVSGSTSFPHCSFESFNRRHLRLTLASVNTENNMISYTYISI